MNEDRRKRSPESKDKPKMKELEDIRGRDIKSKKKINISNSIKQFNTNLAEIKESSFNQQRNLLTELKQNISKLDEVVINNMECDESITNVSINNELYVTNIKKKE